MFTNCSLPKLNPFSKTNSSYLPAAGATLGVLAGTAYNAITYLPLRDKGRAVCSLMETNPVLVFINSGKQLEIKNFAPFTPLLLTAGYLGYKLVARNTEPNGSKLTLSKQLNHEISNLPAESLIKSTALIGSLWGMNNLFRLCLTGSGPDKGFDPSGHVMMTAATAYAMTTVVKHVNNSNYSKIAMTVVLVTALANVIFMSNTTACFHTSAEVLTGAAIATAATLAIDSVNINVPKIYRYLKGLTQNLYPKIQTPVVVEETHRHEKIS